MAERQSPPDEMEIARMLAGLRPNPGRRFYQRMARAPWRRQPRRPPLRRWAPVLVTCALGIIVGLGAVAVPDVAGLITDHTAAGTATGTAGSGLIAAAAPVPDPLFSDSCELTTGRYDSSTALDLIKKQNDPRLSSPAQRFVPTTSPLRIFIAAFTVLLIAALWKRRPW